MDHNGLPDTSNVADPDEGRKIDWPVITTRVPPSVMDLIEAKAAAAGQKVGPWARDALTAAAQAA